jgi:hypothetical protein
MNTPDGLASALSAPTGRKNPVEQLPRGALRFPWAIFAPSLREEMRGIGCQQRILESIETTKNVHAIALADQGRANSFELEAIVLKGHGFRGCGKRANESR